MNNALTEVKPFIYTNPQGLKLEVLFVLDPEKKGYINATAIAKQFDKEPYDWFKYKNVQDYIKALIEKINSQTDNYRFGTKTITYDDIVIIVQGGTPGQNGTWLHPKLAVIFARWLSPHFAVWCDELIAELLNQYPAQQRQFSELAPLFAEALVATEQRLDQRIKQYFIHMDQRISQMIDQRIVQGVDQHLEKMETNFCDILNNSRTQSIQETKHTLGQIFNGINQLNKTLSQQQQADLLKPPIEVGIKQTLLDYQHSLEQMLQQMLHGQQDELIQNYLLAIKDNLERIMQRFVTEPVSAVTQPVTPPTTAPANLATEIAALKAQNWSWQRIAQELNARGTATVSGTGQWHGSSVKRYLESHAAE